MNQAANPVQWEHHCSRGKHRGMTIVLCVGGGILEKGLHHFCFAESAERRFESTSAAEPVNTTPPIEPVRLVFIHHSTGGNWLADEDQNELGGGLARALMENNYYVSATNYGWGPDSIGDATDIPNWLDWFMGERSSVYLSALYAEDGQNFGDFGAWPRLADAPPGENRIIVLNPAFPIQTWKAGRTTPPSRKAG